MKNIFKSSFVFYIIFFVLSCESLKEKEKIFSIDQFNQIQISSMNKNEVEQLLGKPDRKSDNQWTFKFKGSEKLSIIFKNDTVDSVSMAVWEKDKVQSVDILLDNFAGDWTVLKEPMSNPHSAPSLCYLEDLNRGYRVRVGGYQKNVEQISKWKPTSDKKSIKEFLDRNIRKEFCIAESCSKVTYPDAWEHNHCDWLERLVAAKQDSVRKKNTNDKKTNKNNHL